MGYDPKILLANQFAEYFTFGLFDLLNLIPGVHCYIVYLFYMRFPFWWKLFQKKFEDNTCSVMSL